MYCKKCGKFIGTDEDFCYECKSESLMDEPAQSAQPIQPVVQAQVERAGNVMTGFGKALAGTIVGCFGFIFAVVALLFASLGGFTGAFFMVLSLSIAGGVLSLIFGIQSIKTFKREKRAGRKPPVPALVLGICSTVAGGLTLLYALLALLCAVTYVPGYDYDYYYDGYYY